MADMLSSRRFLALVVGAVLLLLFLGLWARHDADAKAQSYRAQNANLQVTYQTQVPKIKLSSLIDISDNGKEDAIKERAVCSTADSLRKTLEDFNDNGLKSSLGSWLSGEYRKTQATQKASQITRDEAAKGLASYVAKCNYFAESTQVSNVVDKIRTSNEYRSSLTYDPGRCPSVKTGCILAENYNKFAKVYDKIVAIYEGYEKYYATTACPLVTARQQTVCKAAKKLASESAKGAELYLAALKRESTDKVGTAARYSGPDKAYRQYKATVQKLNPDVKSIDDYWRQLFIAQEKQLQQLTI
jgi:hypothetical protein